MELNTPLIDAVVAEVKPYSRRYDTLLTQLGDAKRSLVEGIEAGKIYNQEFLYVKAVFTDAMESALKPVHSRFWQAHRDNHQLQNLEINCYQLNHVNARKRGIKKYLHVPEVAEFNAYLDEIVLLNEAINRAKPLIVKGRKPAENTQPVDLTNTGTCAICDNNQKLREQNMVHHGYQISDGRGNYFGIRMGSCPGVGFKPYELSNEANIHFKGVLESSKAARKAYLTRLEAGEVTKFSDPYTVWEKQPGARWPSEVTKIRVTELGDDEFPVRLEREISKVKYEIDGLTYEIAAQADKIHNWTLKPLPGSDQAGEPTTN